MMPYRYAQFFQLKKLFNVRISRRTIPFMLFRIITTTKAKARTENQQTYQATYFQQLNYQRHISHPTYNL
jgi:hypothetical protein